MRVAKIDGLGLCLYSRAEAWAVYCLSLFSHAGAATLPRGSELKDIILIMGRFMGLRQFLTDEQVAAVKGVLRLKAGPWHPLARLITYFVWGGPSAVRPSRHRRPRGRPRQRLLGASVVVRTSRYNADRDEHARIKAVSDAVAQIAGRSMPAQTPTTSPWTLTVPQT